jgi:CXXX repeat modification system protein
MSRVRQNLGVVVNEEELNSMKILRNRITCTEQMLKTIPVGIDQETMDKYVKSVVEERSENEWLVEVWWEKINKKYNLRGEIFIDHLDGSLFILKEK